MFTILFIQNKSKIFISYNVLICGIKYIYCKNKNLKEKQKNNRRLYINALIAQVEMIIKIMSIFYPQNIIFIFNAYYSLYQNNTHIYMYELFYKVVDLYFF